MSCVLELIVLECEAKKENRTIQICEAVQAVSAESWSYVCFELEG